MKLRRIALFYACIAIAAAGAVYGLYAARGGDFLRGIDISHHQGEIDWPRVAAGKTAFVFMKASEGGDFTDPRFTENWRGAGEAGLPRGAYHFFTLCRAGGAQAAHFLRVTQDKPFELPPVLDAEHMGPCRQGPRVDDPSREVKMFLDILEAERGVRPIIYTTEEFHKTYLKTGFENERYWIRSIYRRPALQKENWLFWQYDHRGKVDGIKGPVDLNAFRGNESALSALID